MIYAENLVVDLDNRLILRRGDKDFLTPIEHNLLSLFIKSDNKTLSYDEILDSVWGINYDGASNGTVQTSVSRLRKKLGIKELIETVNGYGYRWNGKHNCENFVRALSGI